MPEARPWFSLARIATAIVLIDQLTKAAVESALGPNQAETRIDIAGRWVSLEYAENRGVAFGLFPELGPALPWASIAIVGVLLLIFLRSGSPPWWKTISIAAIVGGAIGNLIDRFRVGHVIDFLSLGSWPNFNVADSAITVGVLIAIWGWVIVEPRQTSQRFD